MYNKIIRKAIENLIALRDRYLNEGIVIREYIKLKNLIVHSKSGMPLSEEYRLFFLNHTCIGVYDYWEEGDYDCAKPELKQFEEIANTVQSNFFTMDIARKEDGSLIIIELGDGQVSGLPQRADKIEFYSEIKKVMADVC
ncbi:ATP-grasp domain-containing protein [Treponema primitia]|uniref:ATP-grasp domain-containing protein n=1 Tax=Treponema primitia TaxID=88058 RepID=UPI002478F7A6|nr:ATP-grasp domain-containing protein [Treponema primitia]